MYRMLHGMSLRQFNGWRAYADLEPFDEERADARSAQVTWAVLNTSPHRRKGSPSVPLKDCVLKFGPEPEVPVEERRAKIKDTLKLMAAMQKARPKKKARK